ncbi:Mu transposase C-terminal domain-containing protein [Variovorax sp. J22R133]|uniref:Mu transposase C-terminal domain-containing protein n=1 Tax=Variovorax brevis TaxID=3053503 RepID=UPI0025767283|nr:Mu transposase C-terminal domain-containing protein [Variovorax sp. J22R133]MDM0117863.1 Mu transposase C-terminal domain-containing protein [Variovorax sp. J22R133]
MNRGPRIHDVAPSTWPAFDTGALSATEREVFATRRQAIELYAAGRALSEIETCTGIDRRQLYRLLDRCMAPHEDGRLYGWRAVMRYARVGGYRRSARLAMPRDGTGRGAAGAFGLLLEAQPTLATWISQRVRDKRVAINQLSTDDGLRTRLRGLKHLHVEFLRECRSLGLTAADYPFSAEQMGIRSLSAALRAECLRSFERSAHLAGARRFKGLPHQASTPAPTQVLDVVEFDGHRLDVRLKVVVRDPLGFEQQFEIERNWLLVILDVFSRAVLGYHISLNREYSRHDVLRTIEAALEPHRPRSFTLPGVGYGDLGGFPSGKLPELGYATWRWFKLDNAKANLAEDVRHALAEFIGCFIDAGPAHAPDDRPYVERFFGSVAANLSSRLPGYAGTNARDVRRALADPKRNLRLYVSLAELEDLLEAAIATYNGTPHDGLNGRMPLEAMAHSVRGRNAMLCWLPEAKRRTLCLMQTPRRATVRGYLHQGQRPHINFHGVRYTNPVLASTVAFLGQQLRIYYNSQDLRTVRAFAADGSEIGLLKAQGAWGEIVHDLKLRQEVLRLRGRKRLGESISHEFMEAYVSNKLHKAKSSRRAASDAARTLRILAAQPVSASAQVLHSSGPAPTVEAASSPELRVAPERLAIGSGFVGAI